MYPTGAIPGEIRLTDYTYHLPHDRIASHPAEPRDASRLLVWRQGRPTHTHFHALADFLEPGIRLVFNDTKVMPARLHFHRATGARIELFLLQPAVPGLTAHAALRQPGASTWRCLVGNAKRWKPGETLHAAAGPFRVTAARLAGAENTVAFSWQPASAVFADVLPHLGEMPLPPYLNRKATARDAESYQTVYSRHVGAVAAPTAGLHFTDAVLAALAHKGVETSFVTLHVGAGTFLPVTEDNVLHHPMHIEQMVFSKSTLSQLLQSPERLYAVGTTSMRSLESLYWYGVKLLADPSAPFFIEKLYPYQQPELLPSVREALEAVGQAMERQGLDEIAGETQILIVPGYRFRVCKGLVTNFHQPDSTLILLVAAFIGGDWRQVYAEALENGYRFLSYGDSSLLIPAQAARL